MTLINKGNNLPKQLLDKKDWNQAVANEKRWIQTDNVKEDSH